MSKGKVPVRLIAVGGVIILVALGAAIMIPRGGASSSTPPAATSTPVAASTTSTTTAAATTSTISPRTSPKQQPRPSTSEKRRSAIVGVAAIERALRSSPVVVVAAVQPEPVVDRQTAREAQAGAKIAGVPYVRLDVLDEKQARQLFTLLEQNPAAGSGSMPSTPKVMVFRRPRAIFVSFDAYVDREIVAQAAAAATGRPGGEAWQRQANAICTASDRRLSRLPTSQISGSSEDLKITRQGIAMLRAMTASLSRIHAPAARADEYRHVLALTGEVLNQLENLVAAYQKGQGPELVKAYLLLDQTVADVTEGFIALGLTSCI